MIFHIAFRHALVLIVASLSVPAVSVLLTLHAGIGEAAGGKGGTGLGGQAA